MSYPRLSSCISRATASADRITGWMPGCMVLYYHLVPEEQVLHFREQLDCLKARVTVLPAHAAPGDMAHGACASITIDDCFASAVDRAMPLLRARRMPVTLFVPSTRIGRLPDWSPCGEFDPQSEWVISKAMLRSLAADPLVSIGSHGARHVDFVRLGDRDVRAELVDSRKQLEDITGRTVHSFSFPFGRSSPHHVHMAREAGYTHVFGTDPRPHDGSANHLIGRVRVDPWDSPRDFMLKVRGAYRWMPHARALKKKFTHEHILPDIACA